MHRAAELLDCLFDNGHECKDSFWVEGTLANNMFCIEEVPVSIPGISCS